MSICLSVPAVQVGGYSAQQVEIGRHTATPSSQFLCCYAGTSRESRMCSQVTGVSLWLRPYVSTLFFPVVILSPPLSAGIFRHLSPCKFGTAPMLTKYSLTDTRNTREAMRSDATQACRHWLAIRYAPVVISEIIDFEVSPCIFLFYTL